jgi:hypothetical protein
VAVVAIALAGGSQTEPGREAVATTMSAAPPSPIAPSVPRARATLDPSRPRDLLVRGWVARTIGDLHLMVTSVRQQPIAIAAIDPTGKPRNGMVPFEAAFRLPRATAATDLFVVPVDAAGRPLDASAPGQHVEGSVVELVVR